MESIGILIDVVMLLFDHDFTIWGYTFSFFDIFIFSIITGFVAVGLGRLILGD